MVKFFLCIPKIDIDNKVSTSYHSDYLKIKDGYDAIMVMAEEGIEYGNELVLEILKMQQENGKPMSQYRLARAIGLTEQAVYKWVRGQSSPLRENYDKLLEYERYLKLINQRRPSFGK